MVSGSIRIEFDSFEEMKASLLSFDVALNAFAKATFKRNKIQEVDIFFSCIFTNNSLTFFMSTPTLWENKDTIESVWRSYNNVECFVLEESEDEEDKFQKLNIGYSENDMRYIISKIAFTKGEDQTIFGAIISSVEDIDIENFISDSDNLRTRNFIDFSQIKSNEDGVSKKSLKVYCGDYWIPAELGGFGVNDKDGVTGLKELSLSFYENYLSELTNQDRNKFAQEVVQYSESSSAIPFFAAISEEKIENSDDNLFSIKESNESITRFSGNIMAYLNQGLASPRKGDFVHISYYPKNKIAFSQLCADIQIEQYRTSLDEIKYMTNIIGFCNFMMILDIKGKTFTNPSVIWNSQDNFYGFNIFCMTEYEKITKHFEFSSEKIYKSFRQISKIIMEKSDTDIILTNIDIEEATNILKMFYRNQRNIQAIISTTKDRIGIRFLQLKEKWKAVKCGSTLILHNERNSQ